MKLKVGILTEIIKIEVHLFSSILLTALFLSFQQRERIVRELEKQRWYQYPCIDHAST